VFGNICTQPDAATVFMFHHFPENPTWSLSEGECAYSFTGAFGTAARSALMVDANRCRIEIIGCPKSNETRIAINNTYAP